MTISARVLIRLTICLTICLTIAPLALTAAEGETVVRLSEPVSVTAEYEEFGAPVESVDEALSLTELVGAGEEYLGQEVTVTTRIAKVCRKKGCFFIAQEGDTVARITFRDYGFFIPTDSGGRKVTLNGTFTRRELTEAQARHYRQDLGQDVDDDMNERVAPGAEFHIVATAVRIPRG